MYTLHCPSCEHQRREPFVRVGAVTACGSCGHTYRVEPAHVQHHAAPRHQLEAGQADPLLPAGYAPPQDPGPGDAAGQPSTGLTGLSGLMEREKSGPTAGGEGAPGRPAMAQGVSTGSGLGTMTPTALRRRPHLQSLNPRVRWLLLLLLVVLAITVGVLVTMLINASTTIPTGNGQQPTARLEGPGPTPPNAQRVIGPDNVE